MSIVKWLLEKERRFAWSLAGTIVGLASLIVAYVTTAEKRPNVIFTITNESNVLDVHTAVRDLKVLFQDQDLEQAHLHLRIITVRVENAGDVDILQGQYDLTQSWGFAISPGRVIQVRTIGANSDYLINALRPALLSSSTVRLEKVILERNRFAVLEVLVVHPKAVQPALRPFGKIAGIDHIRVNRAPLEAGGESLWLRAASGTPWVQVIRLFVYTFAFVGLLVVILGISSFVESLQERRRKHDRQRQAAEIRAALPNPTQQHDSFLALFVDEGEQALRRALALLSSKKRLRDNALMVDSLSRSGNSLGHAVMMLPDSIEAEYVHEAAHVYPRTRRDLYITRQLIEAGIIQTKDPNMPQIAEGAEKALEEVVGAIRGTQAKGETAA